MSIQFWFCRQEDRSDATYDIEYPFEVHPQPEVRQKTDIERQGSNNEQEEKESDYLQPQELTKTESCLSLPTPGLFFIDYKRKWSSFYIFFLTLICRGCWPRQLGGKLLWWRWWQNETRRCLQKIVKIKKTFILRWIFFQNVPKQTLNLNVTSKTR